MLPIRLGTRSAEGRAMTARARLPNRRLAEHFALEANGLRYTCTIGRFPDGRIGEIFIANHKSNSSADVNARDGGILVSLCLQHGGDIEVIRRALCRNSDGSASGVIGAVLDKFAEQEGQR